MRLLLLEEKWFMKTSQELKKKIIQEAKRIGFHLIGFTSATPLSDIHFYEEWISKEYHADMDYLKRHLEKKRDPKQVMENAKSMMCVGLSYHNDQSHPLKAKNGEGLISNYAWGDDYHEVMREMLEKLNIFLKQEIPALESRAYVDTGPLLERSYAREAGLGWIGKNTCLINPAYGSYVFLGEIITNIEFEK